MRFNDRQFLTSKSGKHSKMQKFTSPMPPPTWDKRKKKYVRETLGHVGEVAGHHGRTARHARAVARHEVRMLEQHYLPRS